MQLSNQDRQAGLESAIALEKSLVKLSIAG